MESTPHGREQAEEMSRPQGVGVFEFTHLGSCQASLKSEV